MLRSDEMREVVDDAFDAVDKSKFGPLVLYPDEYDFTKKQVNQLAFGVFTIVLTGMLESPRAQEKPGGQSL
jgi:hypothetical protein